MKSKSCRNRLLVLAVALLIIDLILAKQWGFLDKSMPNVSKEPSLEVAPSVETDAIDMGVTVAE